MVLVTHDPAVAALADRRIHLLDGRIEREERSAHSSVSSASSATPAAAPSAPLSETAA
jgi:ABC-type lipoprotein export system ATPase subunit